MYVVHHGVIFNKAEELTINKAFRRIASHSFFFSSSGTATRATDFSPFIE
jgi:hypothetical protein